MAPDQSALKRRAAEAAMQFLPQRGVVGLGSGSTALAAIALIAQHVVAGAELVGVATSRASADAARAWGMSLLDEEGPWDVDVTFDGADEVTPALDLIKGHGGALVREKIVNGASRCNVILVDETKRVAALGERRTLPVEITRFGWRQTQSQIHSLAGPASLRLAAGSPFLTDNGNFILDVATGPIPDPRALEQALETLPGVLGCGLFVARTDILVVAGDKGVEILRRPQGA
jgi:ribose 5-phosphate isomerase A